MLFFLGVAGCSVALTATFSAAIRHPNRLCRSQTHPETMHEALGHTVNCQRAGGLMDKHT